MTSIRAVLFDLGGTLLHYHDPHSDDQARHFRRVTQMGIISVYRHLSTNGHTLGDVNVLPDIVDKHIGGAMQTLRETLAGTTVETPIRAAFAELGADLSDEEWSPLRPLFYEPIHSTVFPRDGLQDTLRALQSANYQLALISNTVWAADLHDQHLAENEILDYLPLRIYSCDVPLVKPHPSIFHTALEQLGVGPEEAVYVGDRPDWDVEGAHNAGMRAVLIHSPYVELRDDDPQADAVIDELPELIDVLEEWHGQS